MFSKGLGFFAVVLTGWCAGQGLAQVSVSPSGGELVAGVLVEAATVPPVLFGISGGGSFEVGEAVELGVHFSGAGAGQTYEWRKDGVVIAGADASSYTVPAMTTGTVGIYTAHVSNSGGSSVATTELTIKSPAAPVILAPPYPQVVYVGQEATFSFSASGSYPRTYQWRKNGNPITGATEKIFRIVGASLTDAGTYSVVVSNAQGSATSSSAALTVNAPTPPEFDPLFPGDQTVTQGHSVFWQAYLRYGSPPIGYQWFKDGVAIAGATRQALELPAAALSDAGKYHVVVTNAAGTATSRAASLTVTPATPITFSEHPSSRTVIEGSATTFSVSINGSSPLTLQWLKNGVPMAGATLSRLAFLTAREADAGEYAVRVTNLAGTVTSNKAVLTVEKALAPAITTQPKSRTLAYDDRLQLSVTATGTPPLTFTWKRDGAVISNPYGNYSSLYISSVKLTDAGVYTVVVSNMAGTVTSAGATVTVAAAAKSVITRQPSPTAVALGLDASFGVEYGTSGTGPLSFQWQRNGVAIAGATSSHLRLEAIEEIDAGEYSVVITGAGGSTTSTAAKLTVLPPAPPTADYWPTDAAAHIGGSNTWYAHAIGGSPPFTYRWFKDGVEIAGANSYSLSIPHVTDASYGVYSLVVSNAGGMTAAPPFRLVRPQENAAAPWIDARRLDDVVYFLAHTPTRVERYDLATEQWLSAVSLADPRTPTAFLPAPEGTYVAYGRTIARRSPDFATETLIVNSLAEVTELNALGDFIYYGTSTTTNYSTVTGTRCFQRSTLQPGPTHTHPFAHAVYLPELRRAYAVARPEYYTGSVFSSFLVGADGGLSEILTARTEVSAGARVLATPTSAHVVTTGGLVFDAATREQTSSLGESAADLAFFADRSLIALRGAKLHRFAANTFFETGVAIASLVGHRIFARGNSVYVFGSPGNGESAYRVAKIDAAAFAPVKAAPVTWSAEEPFSIDDVFIGENATVHVFSRSKRALIRWSTQTRDYLSPVPLLGVPALASHTPGTKTVQFAYANGKLTTLALTAAGETEKQFGAWGVRPTSITQTDAFVISTGASARFMIDSEGRVRHRLENPWPSAAIGWNPTNERLYSWMIHSTDTLLLERAHLALGFLPGKSVEAARAPVRFSSDYARVTTGEGRVLDGELNQVGVLANTILDAAWLPSSLITIRPAANGDTEVQQWSTTSYLQLRTASLRGAPLRIFRASDTSVVVLTQNRGFVSFTVLGANLSPTPQETGAILIVEHPRDHVSFGAVRPTLSVAAAAAIPLTYQWNKDGAPIPGAASATVTIPAQLPGFSGLYSATIATGGAATISEPAIVGYVHDQKILMIGAGSEVGANIRHPNGNVYDQVLLESKAASITADPGQVTRLSFIDLNDDIVQVEFAGAGSLNVDLDSFSPAAPPRKYNQPNVSYVKGHASIVITNADETTHVSVFSVGRANAVNQALFRDDVVYDGVADIGYIAIHSRNGKFGGVRTANASYFNTRGVTGLYAPNVEFTGPVFVGEIDASDSARPYFSLEAASDVRIAGGSLRQTNAQPIQVGHIVQCRFVDGSTSHGSLLPAQTNAARFELQDVDVTSEMAPTP